MSAWKRLPTRMRFRKLTRRSSRLFMEYFRRANTADGVTTVIGRVERSDNPFFMKRLPVNSADDLRFFQAKLEGGYDWLRTVQYVSKLRTGGRDARRTIAQ